MGGVGVVEGGGRGGVDYAAGVADLGVVQGELGFGLRGWVGGL